MSGMPAVFLDRDGTINAAVVRAGKPYPPATLDAMHAKLLQLIPQIARIEVCEAPGDDPSRPPDRRRKPEPGMLLDAARDLGLDLARSWMVGDRWRDVDAGRAAGCRTVLIEAGYDEKRSEPDFSVSSLAEACTMILRATERQGGQAEDSRHAHGG